MKRLIVLVGVVALLWGCSMKKPYVGRTVHYTNPLISILFGIPDNGIVETKTFKIDYNIDKIKENTYKVWGTIEYKGPGVFTKIHSGNFRLLVINGGVVIDSLLFTPKQERLGEPMKFEVEFFSPIVPDGVGFTWNLLVRE